MSITYAYLYADSDLEEFVTDPNPIDAERAIELFREFPWEEQFEKVKKRTGYNMSSTIPRVRFKHENGYFLDVSAVDNKDFIVSTFQGGEIVETMISSNSITSNSDIRIEDFITRFFGGRFDPVVEKRKVGSDSHLDKEVVFEMKKKLIILFVPLLVSAVILSGFPIYAFVFDGFNFHHFQTTFLFFCGAALIAFLPGLYLGLRYWFNDRNQVLVYNQGARTITITRKGVVTKLNKTDIQNLKLVTAHRQRGLFAGFSYLRIESTNDVFIVTNLTVDPYVLVEVLKINFDSLGTYYPRLNYRRESELQKAKRLDAQESQKKELLERYENFEIEKLEEILKNKEDYQKSAIAAAQIILDKKRSEKLKS